MKKSTKVIASSVLSIAMCATLITGSTFALFTGHDEENISVTSGNVEVKASVTNLTGFSAKWNGDEYVDNNLGESNPGIFTNKGTWSYSDSDGAGKLTLTNISPGDGVEFNLSIENTSTIKIKYRAQLLVETPTESKDQELLNAMEVTFSGDDIVEVKQAPISTIVTDWVEDDTMPGASSPSEHSVHVRIELPITNESQNEYQGASCSFQVGVYAIQANANTPEPPKNAAFIVYTPQDFVSLSNAVKRGKSFEGQTVALADNIYLDGSASRTAARLSAYVLADTLASTAVKFDPIGTKEHPFKGTFDGRNNTIYNLHVENENASLFGYVQGATIQNVNFVDVVRDEGAGAIVVGNIVADEEKTTTITNVTVSLAEKSTVEGAANGGLFDEGSKENVTITDTTVEESDNTKTTWDEEGNHSAQDAEGNVSYFVGSAEDITNLVSKAEAGKPVNVVLEGDLTLEGSTSLAVNADLTIDVGGHNLVVKSQGTNAGIQVEAGKNLTIKGTGAENEVQLDSASSKPAISVSGADATLDIQGANVSVKNTNSGNSPAIVAENGASVNIGGGSKITVTGQGHTSAYKEPQFITATGKGSTINIDDEKTVIDLNNATGIYAENNGTINFKNGKLNMTGGSCCVGLGLGAGAGKIVFSGGVINITGDLSGTHIRPGLKDFAIAIGSPSETPNGGTIIVNGGTININNTGGSAIAVGGAANDTTYSMAYVGGGVAINVQATGNGKAYAFASETISSGLRIYYYDDTNINITGDSQNFIVPRSEIGGYFSGTGVTDMSFRGNLPEEYTKEAMELI